MTTSSSPHLEATAKFRKGSLDNGYRLVSVETAGKAPAVKNWTAGEEERSLLVPNARNANTGIVLHGLRAIDVDVDDPHLVVAIKQVIIQDVPPEALFRVRVNSSRFAVLVRSEGGKTEKLTAGGAQGKVEVLGSSQQLVGDGLHPSGVAITWRDGRSPASVPVASLPVLTEQQILGLLEKFNVILGAPPNVTADRNLNRLNRELSSGFDSWFTRLTPLQMNETVKTCLDYLDNTQNDPREQWLQIIFAVHHSEDLGCTNARDLACNWSKVGKGWTGEDTFDKAWNSYRPGGIGVGTLLHLAQASGANLSTFRSMANSVDHSKNGWLNQGLATSGCFITPLRLADLPLIPEKRQWLHGTDLVRGAVSLLVSPGGRGKSTWLIHMAIACATGCNLLDAKVFGGPLRVLYVNAEDSTEELHRRFSAAILHHKVNSQSLDTLRLVGSQHAHFSLLEAHKGLAQLSHGGWEALQHVVKEFRPDVVIIDPLVALVGGASLNDNSAAAMMMKALTKMAAESKCGIMIAHHTAKGADVANQEAAMGAASLVNMSRISLAVATLTEEQAPKVGVMSGQARNYFRVISAKQNLSPPAADGRWFQIVPVNLNNAIPPIYPRGDDVAVIELFTPTSLSSTLSPALLSDLRDAVRNSHPPLSPSRRSQTNSAASRFASILSAHRRSPASDGEGQILVKELQSRGLLKIMQVTVGRNGRGGYPRDGLVWADGMVPPDKANQKIGDDLATDGLVASSDATKQ
jgi:hypothetical protein